jgi:hypothetical protein
VNDGGSGPLVIGGVGGSGTRVVAEMARRLGVWTGPDLNGSVDTLWATLLLRRPTWYAAQSASGGEGFATAFGILEDALNGRLVLTPGTRRFLELAGEEQVRDGRSPGWVADRLASLAGEGTAGTAPGRWGWKAPVSHVYLAPLHRHFGRRLRYVHVIRNGPDMAFSDNQWQVRTWGPLYGLDPDGPVTPATSLDFWIRANRRAVDYGATELGDAFLRLDFDALCADPAAGVARLVGFLGLEPSPGVLDELLALPRRPHSTGRGRRAGGGVFTTAQLAAVADLGFPVDR